MSQLIPMVIGADHRGFEYKERLIRDPEFIARIRWHDVGAHTKERSDYPLFAHAACEEFLKGVVSLGVLICGSGIGMAITANRYRGVRSGVVWDTELARVAKEHDDVNFLVIPSDYVSYENAQKMIDIWLRTSFNGGRYQLRVDMIDR